MALVDWSVVGPADYRVADAFRTDKLMINLKKSRNNRTGKPGAGAREQLPLPGRDSAGATRDADTGRFVSQPLRRAGAGEVRRSASRMKDRFSGALANLKNR